MEPRVHRCLGYALTPAKQSKALLIAPHFMLNKLVTFEGNLEHKHAAGWEGVKLSRAKRC